MEETFRLVSILCVVITIFFLQCFQLIKDDIIHRWHRKMPRQWHYRSDVIKRDISFKIVKFKRNLLENCRKSRKRSIRKINSFFFLEKDRQIFLLKFVSKKKKTFGFLKFLRIPISLNISKFSEISTILYNIFGFSYICWLNPQYFYYMNKKISVIWIKKSLTEKSMNSYYVNSNYI